ncbi:MAG: hypothetical protein KGV44_14030 [Flavobacteriaceae bacterium]|nr:hypothetical protein [Flavobacteriaceae bacterium]
MKILKCLMIGLVMFVASCSSDKDDDNIIANKFPKDVTIEVKIYPVKKEQTSDVFLETFEYTQFYIKRGHKNATLKDATFVEKTNKENVKLPFYKKKKCTVHLLETIIIRAVPLEVETEFITELLVDEKVVARQISYTPKQKGNIGGITYTFH